MAAKSGYTNVSSPAGLSHKNTVGKRNLVPTFGPQNRYPKVGSIFRARAVSSTVLSGGFKRVFL